MKSSTQACYFMIQAKHKESAIPTLIYFASSERTVRGLSLFSAS